MFEIFTKGMFTGMIRPTRPSRKRYEVMTVNMYEAKTKLSFLVKKLNNKEEPEIVIANNGTPVARLVPYTEPDRPWGLLKDKYAHTAITQEEFDSSNEEIAEMFGV